METRLLKKQMTAAYQYSYTRLALNYYTLFETMTEEAAVSGAASSYCQTLNQVMEAFLKQKDIAKPLATLRKDVTHEVEIETSYTDCFQIYEYVTNRLERKFKTMDASPYDDGEFVKRLLHFITDTKDAMVMNGRISQIVGQLPVRLTKQKFFGLVSEGLSVYISSPKQSLQDMMYKLKTESMAELPADMAEHKELYEILQQFLKADYRTVTKPVYEELTAKLSYVTNVLMDESGLFVMLQEIINDLYVLLLAKEDAVMDVKEEELYRSLLQYVNRGFERPDAVSEKEMEEKLKTLEGRQEAYYDRYLRLSLPAESEELKGDRDYIRSANVDRLLSGSSFAELLTVSGEGCDCQEDDGELVDKAFLEQITESFYVKLEELFSQTSRPVIRAIMAKILSDLPVYFNSVDEISTYIQLSLESCQDEAEKETCKELLEELMDYENMLV